jgi:DNA (cytosine-5)-methyltransferase 1
MPGFYEFFCGGGMARAGLGAGWNCLLANDLDPRKASVYEQNWGRADFLLGDVAQIGIDQLPAGADLAWASSPCQDVSLAGLGAGLAGERSGAFWPFWGLMQKLRGEARHPRLIVLENVTGLLTAHGGQDFAAVIRAFSTGGYRVGAFVLDAKDFLPQSRPRLFVVGVRDDQTIPGHLTVSAPTSSWHPASLVRTVAGLPDDVGARWLWWHLPAPAPRRLSLADLVETPPRGVDWHSEAETQRLLDQMSPLHRARVESAVKIGKRIVGAIYKRTRLDETGIKRQRPEVRFDGLAGCLRTPAGGSSRQTLLIVEDGSIRSRLLSPREAARLMGLPDDYWLPRNYNEAYHLAGDGVAVPAVRFIASSLLEPLLGLCPMSASAVGDA